MGPTLGAWREPTHGDSRPAAPRRRTVLSVPDRLSPYVVVDLDGVLADVRHRVHHVERRPKDWAAFFAAATDDPVLPEGRATVDALVAVGRRGLPDRPAGALPP